MNRLRSPRVLLALTFLGFISLGLPDAINGVIWPSVSNHFNVPLGNLGLFLIAFTAGYLTASLSIVRLLEKLGVGGLLTMSCGFVILSLVGFATAPTWSLYLLSSVFAGLGAGAIDTGLNAYAARHFSAKHMTWLHACWGIGASTGAAIAAAVIAQNFSWRWSPLTLALILTPITIIFFFARAAWSEDAPVEEGSAKTTQTSARLTESLRHPLVWLQALIFFLYVGTEASFGQWAYTLLTQARGVSETSAGFAVSLYWISLTAGRFVLGSIADRVPAKKMIGFAMSSALVGGLIFVLSHSVALSTTGLMIVGVSFAPIYPGLMSQTPSRLGRYSESTIGFQIASGLLGAVAIPSLGGILVRAYGVGSLNSFFLALAPALWLLTLILIFEFVKLSHEEPAAT